MSRTDKDRPYWVRSEDPLEPREEYHYHHDWRGNALECDLDAPAKYKPSLYSNCGYRLRASPYTSGPPAWYRNHVWHDPERVRMRDELGEVRKLANAGEELDDVDVASWQHRHCAIWLWT